MVYQVHLATLRFPLPSQICKDFKNLSIKPKTPKSVIRYKQAQRFLYNMQIDF